MILPVSVAYEYMFFFMRVQFRDNGASVLMFFAALLPFIVVLTRGVQKLSGIGMTS